jgi:hypothetical protein
MSKYLDFIGQQISQVKVEKSGTPNTVSVIKEKVSEGWPYVLGTLAFTGIASVVYNKVKSSKESNIDKDNTYPLEIDQGEFLDQDATMPYVFDRPEPMEAPFGFDDKTEVMERLDAPFSMPLENIQPKELTSQQYEETEIIDRNPPINLFQESSMMEVSDAQDTLELPPKSGAANEEIYEYPSGNDEVSGLVKEMGLSDFMGDEMQNFLNTTGDGSEIISQTKVSFDEQSVKDQLSRDSKTIDDVVGGDSSAFGNISDFSKYAEDQGPAVL